MTKAALETSIANLDTWIQVFAVLVAIGIVGEVGFGVRHWVLNRRLVAIQHVEDLNQEQAIATFNKEAGEARRDAAAAIERAAKAEENLGSAKRDAALAEQHAAEANKTAEGEKIERLKLQASIQPRRLTAEQKNRLASLLKPFAATPMNLAWVGPGGQESADLASDINDAIATAGITIKSRNILMDQYFKGVFLKAGNDRLTQADVIAAFLIETGLSKKPVGLQAVPDAQELTIVVGSKP
jgi:hypothetical protein